MNFENNFEKQDEKKKLETLRKETIKKHKSLLQELKNKGLSREESEELIRIGLLKMISERFGPTSREFIEYKEKI